MRQQLAVYRRSDWPVSYIPALTEHLLSCAACRKVEADYRAVGSSIRQLPSIVPPPDLRERVFAAILAEQQRASREMERFAAAPTDPALPVVRPGARPFTRQRSIFNLPAAVAVAASLLLILFVARVIPGAGGSLNGTAASVGAASPLSYTLPNKGHVTRYALAPRFTATSALATASWLVFSAMDPDRHFSVMAENRATRTAFPLMASTDAKALSVRALTNQWAVVVAGTGTSQGAWRLLARKLGSRGNPLTLVDTSHPVVLPPAAPDTPVSLDGVWAKNNTVLVTTSTSSGVSLLLRMDLGTAPGRVALIARSAPGHVLTNPSEDNGTYYWSDVWYDTASGLHSTIWAGDGAGHMQQISPDDMAFAPSVVGKMLVWAEVPRSALMASAQATPVAQAEDTQQMVAALHGTLDVRDLASGQQWQISSGVQVSSIERSDKLVIWRGGHQMGAYNLQTHNVSLLANQMRDARLAGSTGKSVVWESPSSPWLYVYDAA